ncbi:tetratricopeptide repeat protein [Pollutibacter soli]|uniref:tetratricopeptide repeat protein n=1 Tax=Pollutibacter soli TaxID=3034157 RepID=UPI003013B47A
MIYIRKYSKWLLTSFLFPGFFSCGNTENKVVPADSTSQNIAHLEKEVSSYPDSPLIRLELADAYENAGKAEKAIDMYDSLLTVDSTNALWYNRKASLYLSIGDTASALSTLRASLNAQPAQPDLLLEVGFIYADMKNDSALGIASFMEKSPDPRMKTNAMYLRGLYYSNIGQIQKALAAYDECIIYDYTFIDAYLEKGILLYNQKRYAEALKIFEKARTVSNTNADAYFWTGKTYEAMDKKEEAIEFYKKTLGLDDKIAEAEDRLKNLEK